MEALRATYGDASSDSDTDDLSPAITVVADSGENSTNGENEKESFSLPPPPLSLLDPPGSTGFLDFFPTEPGVRVRSFPHVDGNYALHVYIPVSIPPEPKKEIICFLKKVASVVPHLHLVEADIPLSILCKDDQKLEHAMGREFHISLGRGVPLRVHQINSVVSLLRQKLQNQKRYWIDFNKWEVFVNDDCTRSFLSLEITTSGLSEIIKQIHAVNEVYKLHNLPEFYKDPRPHISLVWALGDIKTTLKGAVDREMKKLRAGGCIQSHIFTTKFCGIESCLSLFITSFTTTRIVSGQYDKRKSKDFVYHEVPELNEHANSLLKQPQQTWGGNRENGCDEDAVKLDTIRRNTGHCCGL